MAVSEKKKASNAKWDSVNMSTLGCRVKKELAEAFKAYCTIQGRTSNSVLRDYVLGCIGEGPTEGRRRHRRERAGFCGPGGGNTGKAG